MAIRIPWDKYEAAILLDGLLEIKENNTSKTSVVKRISKQLREMALNKGIVIDNIFRNENGISFQLQSMNSAYENTNNGKPSTKLFDEIVYIYRTNRNSYEQILREAQSMISNTKKNQSAFFSFVESKEPKWYNNIFVAMSAINDFAIKTKVVDSSIYNDLSESLIGLLNKKVIRNKFFVVKNKKNMLYAELGLKLFHMYITENNLANIVPDDAVSTTKGYDGGDEFIEWMINERSLSKSTAKSYRSALNTCNDYAHKNGIYKNSIIFAWDEFSEFFLNHPMGLTGFQTLSEISNSHPFYFVIVTHEAEKVFSDKNAASKLLDRFQKPVEISLPENTAFKLLSQAMKITNDPVLCDEWNNRIKPDINGPLAEVRKYISMCQLRILLTKSKNSKTKAVLCLNKERLL